MKILAIETSCDETAISIIEAGGGFGDTWFKILANVVHSQVAEHAPYGGVFPALAKREHGKNLIPVLLKALGEARFLTKQTHNILKPTHNTLETILEREPELLRQFLNTIPELKIPDIDAIALTNGPGLEPALWVGVNFAKALSLVWNKPIIPTNHMAGHFFSAFIPKEQSEKTKFKIDNLKFPILALLVSGGHTELVLMKDWGKFEKIGQTRDDAVGEAFDKVARLLDLPYPGGPEISKLAEKFGLRESKLEFPRPMLRSKDYDFSFSGLKTAVLYAVKKLKEGGNLSQSQKEEIAYEFQQAVIDVLVEKTIYAGKQYNAQTIILGGGVAGNTELRKQLKEAVQKNLPYSTFHTPQTAFAGDNAAMIAIAGYFTYLEKGISETAMKISADGNLSL